MQMVRDILMYMDRTYVSFNKKMPVYEMGLVVFRDTVARHEKVKGRLQSLLLQVRPSLCCFEIFRFCPACICTRQMGRKLL